MHFSPDVPTASADTGACAISRAHAAHGRFRADFPYLHSCTHELLGRSDPPLVAVPAVELRHTEPPGDAERRPAKAAGIASVLALQMVESTDRRLVPILVAAPERSVADVMHVQVPARRAAGRRAAPTRAVVDRIERPARHAGRVVPDPDAFLDERQERDPAP